MDVQLCSHKLARVQKFLLHVDHVWGGKKKKTVFRVFVPEKKFHVANRKSRLFHEN